VEPGTMHNAQMLDRNVRKIEIEMIEMIPQMIPPPNVELITYRSCDTTK